MDEDRSSLSYSGSYREIGDFWDTQDLGDHWDRTEPAEFEVDIRSSAIYYPVDRNLAAKLNSAAGLRGVSAETLLNLWLQEKMAEEASTK